MGERDGEGVEGEEVNYGRMLDQLREDEGFRSKPYRCTAGKLTIGYGRNLDDVGISKEEANVMLGEDVRGVIRQLNHALPWWSKLTFGRQEALVNMGFNLGVPRLLGFKNMLAALQRGDYAKAADEALDSLWAKQVGDRAKRVAKLIREG